jgi:hypothetical protein
MAGFLLAAAPPAINHLSDGHEKMKANKTKSPGRTGHQKSEAGDQAAAAPADVMLSKEELAAKLKVSLRSIENWQHEGYLPFIKVASVVMFHWPTVLAHLQTRFSVAPCGGPPVRAGLASFFNRQVAKDAKDF